MYIICIGVADAAVRDENTTNRGGNSVVTAALSGRAATSTPGTTLGRTATTPTVSRQSSGTVSQRTVSGRTGQSGGATRTNTSRAAAAQSVTSSRAATTSRVVRPTANTSRAATINEKQTVSRAAATTTATMTDTRIGAAYEQCKTAYFNCMDQFCQLKNDDYRRCSCSNRVFELDSIRDVMQDASNQLTVFTENLDVVGMTAAQATAMRTESEGETALTSDSSASKALLQAIMNSIRGEDTTVGGKFTDLNTINLSFDTTNAFGTSDAGQIIATYNGQNLYSAVYPQCRDAVRADCDDAQLQRAINAYLMAIEQDCNTVASALDQQQSQMKAAVRESSAMLDLARVENRQNHNSDDMATCLANVEAAVLSEEVCGANYHKCLDNGEFIDVSTGAPISGVENFYELGNLLKFAENVDAADQKLSKVSSNRTFVQNFEKRVKKFAEPALDKCTEDADTVWSEYLDKAMLDIYYAQQSKVAEIKQGCFDFVSACYMNGEAALTAAMAELVGDDGLLLQPDVVNLSTEMCRDYINSCNMMFFEETGNQNIVTDYINNRQDTDTLTACRAVVQQCFDTFGGDRYENFYYPYSGLFTTGEALEWFTLWEYDPAANEDAASIETAEHEMQPVSKCAQQLMEIPSCSTKDMMERAFGGFDVFTAAEERDNTLYILAKNGPFKKDGGPGFHRRYGTLTNEEVDGENKIALRHHTPRPSGVATEIYNQIVDVLTTQCINLQGRFVELQLIKDSYNQANLCEMNQPEIDYSSLLGGTAFCLGDVRTNIENMCPKEYELDVDTQSWGACLCWENGGRRSKNGTSPRCMPVIPVSTPMNDAPCVWDSKSVCATGIASTTIATWCTQEQNDDGQVCPVQYTGTSDNCTADYPEVPESIQ